MDNLKTQMPSVLLIVSFVVFALGSLLYARLDLPTLGKLTFGLGAATGVVSLILLASAARQKRSIFGLLRFLAASIMVFFMLWVAITVEAG